MDRLKGYHMYAHAVSLALSSFLSRLEQNSGNISPTRFGKYTYLTYITLSLDSRRSLDAHH